jgi:hypothetical protein
MAKKKSVIEKTVESAIDATEELGRAASSFRESWSHVQKAKEKGRPATHAAARAGRAVARGGKKAWGATKRTAKRVTGRRK